MKLLIIVDPQNDFITGSLPVPGARAAIQDLAEYIKTANYDLIYVTLDWHPSNHCSFDIYPPHCIQHSEGAAIEPSLFKALIASGTEIKYVTKGESPSRDAYSFLFEDEDYYESFETIEINANKRMYFSNITEVHVCGLAGDICVYSTLRDLVEKMNIKPKVLSGFIASTDDGSTLENYCKLHNIEMV